jgi:type II secretory pathway predicted ATPase ExeA
MYYDYFGLKQPPFKITPDTSMFYPGGNRGAILEALIYTILNGEGIIKVVGEVGSGKTMLCRMLEKELPSNVEVVYIANPSLSPENILHAIAFDLDLAVQADTSRLEVMNRLQDYLLTKHSEGRHVVVFIEEAQSMPVATLEEIRLLSNLETRQNKLLQIVLFGQPELDELISQHQIRQLKERITYSFQLNPFATEDIHDYLNTRLRSCGYRSGELFHPKSVKLIERYSAGLVRRINILADKSLLAAYAANTSHVTPAHVRQAARDSEFVTDRFLNFRRYGFPGLLAVAAGLVLYWQFIAGSDQVKVSVIESVTAPAAHNEADAAGNRATVAAPGRVEEASASVSEEQIDHGVTPASDSMPEGSGNDVGKPIDSTNYLDVMEPAQPSPLIANTDVSPTGDTPGNEGREQPAGTTDIPLTEETVTAVSRQGADDIENRLLGLDGIFDPAQMAGERYTDEELQLLREQLERFPPELAYDVKPSSESDSCRLCWSFIYRPLVRASKP